MLNKFLITVGLTVCIAIGMAVKIKQKPDLKPEKPSPQSPNPTDINEYLFGYKTYKEIETIFLDWELKAKDLVDVGYYGPEETKHLFIKISNEFNPSFFNASSE